MIRQGGLRRTCSRLSSYLGCQLLGSQGVPLVSPESRVVPDGSGAVCDDAVANLEPGDGGTDLDDDA
jgi:hypothetical protein